MPRTLTVVSLNTERTWRGGEGQTLALAAGLVRRGHRSLIVAQKDGELARRARAGGLEVAELRMRGELDPLAVVRLARQFRRIGPDVIHMHTSHAHTLGVIGSILARRGRRLVSRRVDFSIHRHRLGLSGLKYRHGVHRYVAISHAIRDALIRDGIDPARISVVHSGIDPDRFLDGDGAVARAELGIPAPTPLFGTVAHFGWHKSLETLIEATPRLVEQVPDAHVAIIGDGDLRPQLEAIRASTPHGDRIHMPGFRSNVGDYLHAFDVFVMPSVMEGLCTSVLDAFATGVPVVASRAGGLPELVEHEATGLLTSPGDPTGLAAGLVRMHRDTELRRRVVEAAREKLARSFTHDAMVEGNLAVYREVLSGVPPSR